MDKKKLKNNNLVKHKEDLQKRNKALIIRAIKHIEQVGGKITMSMVSKVSYEIAKTEDKEKGITLAGISKNATYRALVEEAQAKEDSGINHNTVNKGKTNDYSNGDIRLMLHALRVENIELKRTNKVLVQQIKEIPDVIQTVAPIEDTLIKEYNAMRNMAKSLVTRLCELEVAYIDADEQSLKMAHFGYVIIPYEALKIFYEKELNDIQCKIREDASNG